MRGSRKAAWYRDTKEEAGAKMKPRHEGGWLGIILGRDIVYVLVVA
jgi:hypothetical protein